MKINVATVMGPAIAQYKGVVNFSGILVGLEHVAGNNHRITGKQVDVSYGDVPGSQGVDGDPVDVLLGADWSAPVAFVLQDAHVTDKDAPGDPDQYGEDKIALGFRSEAEARAAHAAYYAGDQRRIVGCIASTVAEVRERINCPAEAGLPWFAKSHLIVSDLVKAQKPPAGFTPIPKTKHGGYRKRRSGGKAGYTYWYADQHHHKDAPHGWEAHHSAGRGVQDAQAGKFFRIEGLIGTYVYAPDSTDKTPKGTAAFVQYDPETGHGEGEPVFASAQDVVRLRAKDEPKKRSTPKPKPRTATPRRAQPRKKQTPASVPAKPRATFVPRPPRELTDGGDDRPRSRVFKHSRAKEGTALHRLENGHYPLVKIRDDHYTHNRVTAGVDVPNGPEKEQVCREFLPLIDGAARKVAAQFRIPYGSEDYNEVVGGSQLGFMLALRSYSGARPFIPHAQDFANVYATTAARQSLRGGNAHVPRRSMQLAHGLIAARNRARKSEDTEPTTDQIASAWRCKKRDIYASDRRLGNYMAADGEDVVSQDGEELPLDDWHIRGPDGKELGDAQPGKRSMITRLRPVMDGERAEGSDWMERHDQGLLPQNMQTHAGMSVGTGLHAHSEVQDILTDMPPEHALTISVLFGIDNDYTDGLAGKEGRDGRAMTDNDLADVLGLSDPEDTPEVRARKGSKARRAATTMFKREATERRAMVRRHVDGLTKPKQEFFSRADSGESQRQMKERFGTDERVSLYRVGLRSGDKDRVGKILDRDKVGQATTGEMEDLRGAYYQQRNADRMTAFKMQTAHHVVEPGTASDVPMGTDPNADHLYIDELLHNAMMAVASGARPAPAASPDSPEKRAERSKVMTSERFARFMGRPTKPITPDKPPTADAASPPEV